MSSLVEIFTEKEFDEQVRSSDKLTIVDFWAEWCGPCRMIAPTLEQVAADNAQSVRIAKLNVDEGPAVTVNYGVRNIPTLLFFKNGSVVDVLTGAKSRDEIQQVINSALRN